MMNKLFVLAFLILSVGCSPIYRHNHLVEKFPYVHTQDTVTLIDTISILVPEIRHDTLLTRHFFSDIRRDTFVIEKERLTIKIFHDTVLNNVYIHGKCDTVFKEKIVTRKVPIRYYKTESSWIKWVIIIIVSMLLLCSILRHSFCKKD